MGAVPQIDLDSLPGKFVPQTPLTDSDFEALCLNNRRIRFERTRRGEILVNPPTGLLTSDANSEICNQLREWWAAHRRGRVFESNAGYFLADGSMLSPDASYVSAEKLKGLSKAQLARLGRLCPEFVIELLSPSNSLKESREKMALWIENGVQLGWLVDPDKRRVIVYRPGVKPVSFTRKRLRGDGPVEGFTLDLERVWERYEV